MLSPIRQRFLHKTLSLESLATFLPGLKSEVKKFKAEERIESSSKKFSHCRTNLASQRTSSFSRGRNEAIDKKSKLKSANRFDRPRGSTSRYVGAKPPVIAKKTKLKAIEGSIRTIKVPSLVDTNFNQLLEKNLSTRLFELKNIQVPTAIQLALFQHLANSKVDLMVKAETGSGKSLGYVLAILDYLKNKPRREVEVMVLAPSVMLGEQVTGWLRELKPDVSVGNSIEDRPTVLVSTGRNDGLRTFLAAGNIIKPSLVVVDETDALLKPLRRFATAKERECRLKHPNTTLNLLQDLRKVNPSSRLVYISATLNRRTKNDLMKAKLLPRGAVFLDASPKEDVFFCPRSISHHHIFIPGETDFQSAFVLRIKQILQKEKCKGLLFLPATLSKSDLMHMLQQSNIKCDYLSRPFEKHAEEARLLVGSHSDARGLDMPSVGFVVLWGVPDTPNSYLHCAGRVGRMGKAGNVYSLLGPDPTDLHRYTSISQYLRFESQIISAAI